MAANKGPFATPDMGNMGEGYARLVSETPDYSAAEASRGAAGAADAQAAVFGAQKLASIGGVASALGQGAVDLKAVSVFGDIKSSFDDINAQSQEISADLAKSLSGFSQSTDKLDLAVAQGKLKQQQLYTKAQQQYNQLVSLKPELAREAAMVMKDKIGYDPTRGSLTGSSSSSVNAIDEQLKQYNRLKQTTQGMLLSPSTAHFVVLDDPANPNSININKTMLHMRELGAAQEALKQADVKNAAAINDAAKGTSQAIAPIVQNGFSQLSHLATMPAGASVQYTDASGKLTTMTAEQAFNFKKVAMANQLREQQALLEAKVIGMPTSNGANVNSLRSGLNSTLSMIDQMTMQESAHFEKASKFLQNQVSAGDSAIALNMMKKAPEFYTMAKYFPQMMQSPEVMNQQIAAIEDKLARGEKLNAFEQGIEAASSAPNTYITVSRNISDNVPISNASSSPVDAMRLGLQTNELRSYQHNPNPTTGLKVGEKTVAPVDQPAVKHVGQVSDYIAQATTQLSVSDGINILGGLANPENKKAVDLLPESEKMTVGQSVIKGVSRVLDTPLAKTAVRELNSEDTATVLLDRQTGQVVIASATNQAPISVIGGPAVGEKLSSINKDTAMKFQKLLNNGMNALSLYSYADSRLVGIDKFSMVRDYLLNAGLDKSKLKEIN